MQATGFPTSGLRRVTRLCHQPPAGWKQRSGSRWNLGSHSCQPWSLGQRRRPQPKLHFLAPHGDGSARHSPVQYVACRAAPMRAPRTNGLQHPGARAGCSDLSASRLKHQDSHIQLQKFSTTLADTCNLAPSQVYSEYTDFNLQITPPCRKRHSQRRCRHRHRT
jgi:hypothetical protein